MEAAALETGTPPTSMMKPSHTCSLLSQSPVVWSTTGSGLIRCNSNGAVSRPKYACEDRCTNGEAFLFQPSCCGKLTGSFSQRRPSKVRVRNQSASRRRGSPQGPSPVGRLISKGSSSGLSPSGCKSFSYLFICTVFLSLGFFLSYFRFPRCWYQRTIMVNSESLLAHND